MSENYKKKYMQYLFAFSHVIFSLLGIGLCLVAFFLASISAYDAYINFFENSRGVLLGFVSYLVISVAIFDVGRYLLEEEVLRERELRSPKEARQSITKFMTIIVIAVTLEALLHLLKVQQNLEDLVYPGGLLLIAVALLIGLGIFQRLSASTEKEVKDERSLPSSSLPRIKTRSIFCDDMEYKQ